jgi:uncharacterized protein with ParB-like and HNH nuclease domain
MKANETKLQPLIEGTKQYLVPLFQRPYRWDKTDWKHLWADLRDLQDEPERTHFMGSIVTMPAHTVPEGINKYLLIDGQQRLTTIFIVLAAIRDKAKLLPGKLADKIDNLYLLNNYQEDEERFKLLPTQQDRAAFVKIVSGGGAAGDTPLGMAYAFFTAKLGTLTQEQLELLLAVLIGRLVFVSIVLAHDDNPYLIFESLNAKGRPLTQADLIRNYCFMSIHTKKQENVYANYWRPMEDRLGANMTEFIRHFLTKEGAAIKQGEIYSVVKASTATFKENEILQYLDRMKLFSEYYLRLIDPSNEPIGPIRQRLQGLNRLDITTAYPFLLNVYHDFKQGSLSEVDFLAVLEILESYLVRRFVCGVPTHGLNKVFPPLYAHAKAYPVFVDGVATVLKSRNFPKNTEFLSALDSARLYGSGERAAKTKYLLERLEASYEHHEHVVYDNLTIEHVMPQTLTDWWKDHLGPNWEDTYDKLVHTIGNLTLTGYNSDLSNASFDEKKGYYKDSHVEITKAICAESSWTAEVIQKRGADLGTRAEAIWPYYGAVGDEAPLDSPPGDPATSPEAAIQQLGGGTQIKYQYYALHSGQKVLVVNSKHHPSSQHYWYGISPASLTSCEEQGVTHVAFGMGTKAIALVPIQEVRDFIQVTKATLNADKSIKHYHVFISDGPDPEMYWSETKPKVRLEQYLVTCHKEPASASS